MSTRQAQALVRLIRPLADDEWIVGHRGSEWLGLAPDLEEDLAFSSIHQDEMGHAQFFFELLHALGDDDADRQVYFRPAWRWANACFVEQENGDWAKTVVRRYFYEVFDAIRLAPLADFGYAPLRDGCKKIQREEAYHLRHFATWFEILALGGDDARQRLVSAIDALWPTLPDLFSWGQSEAFLDELGLDALHSERLRQSFEDVIKKTFDRYQLKWPGSLSALQDAQDGRLGRHTPAFEPLLAVMTEVRQIAPDSVW
jgi:ring-1,2-phenylacetyl-CoA epoxidase subunit PaaC